MAGLRGGLRQRGRLRRGLAWAALVSVVVCAEGQQATLVGDAHVSSAQPTVNAGSLSNLNVGGGYTALVQFDLSTLPAGTTAAQISRATLRVFCNRADAPGAVQVQAVGGAWTESAVTYATLPPLGATVQTAQVSAAGQFVAFDVTQAVQAWVSGAATNNGLALVGATGTVVQFDSKESDQTSHEPVLEIALAAGGSGTVGAIGPTGATGATGATGPQGIPGANGAQGLAGAAGATGAMGAVGATGATGANGATGPQGIAGVAGANGATGATGPQGPQGVQGATGPAGVGVGVPGSTGATGATGPAGLTYQGAYSATTNYALGDVVVFGGSSYASLLAGNAGQTPGLSPAYWGLLSAQGPQGAVGATGVAGPTGATGSVGPMGPAGAVGATGAQGVAGQAGAQGIAGVTGATGLQGPAGPTGAQGPVGLNFIGAYDSTVNYAAGDGVSW